MEVHAHVSYLRWPSSKLKNKKKAFFFFFFNINTHRGPSYQTRLPWSTSSKNSFSPCPINPTWYAYFNFSTLENPKSLASSIKRFRNSARPESELLRRKLWASLLSTDCVPYIKLQGEHPFWSIIPDRLACVHPNLIWVKHLSPTSQLNKTNKFNAILDGETKPDVVVRRFA